MSASPQTWWLFWVIGKQLYQLISVPCFSKHPLAPNGCAVAQRSLPAIACKGFWSRGAAWASEEMGDFLGERCPEQASTSQGSWVPHFHCCEIHAHTTLWAKPQVTTQIFFWRSPATQAGVFFLVHFISQTLKEVGGYLAFCSVAFGVRAAAWPQTHIPKLSLHRPCTEWEQCWEGH